MGFFLCGIFEIMNALNILNILTPRFARASLLGSFSARRSRDISSWNVESVTTMHAMFYKAISFDKSTIKSWNLTSIKSKGYRP